MSIFRRKKQTDAETESLKSFLDMIAPSIVKFETGYYICGNTFRCIWALREYPTSTDDLAILRHLGEKHGVTLHIYTRMATYGAFRFFNEFFRTSSSEMLFHLSHLWAVIAFVVGLSIYAETKARNRKGKKVKRK